MPKGGELLCRLMHLASGFLTLFDTDRNLYRGLIRTTIFQPAGDTPHTTDLSELYLQFLNGMIGGEKARGAIRPEVDARVAALAVFSLYIGVVIMLFRRPEMSVATVAELLAAMTGQYLQGLSGGCYGESV
jgi:hypothetical protein